MSIQYGSLYVDEQYKATVLPNLFYKTWLVPGVTYQDVMVDGAGGCYWHKLTSTAASVGTPGRDFKDTAAADTLVQAVFNNNLQASKKIYGVQPLWRSRSPRSIWHLPPVKSRRQRTSARLPA